MADDFSNFDGHMSNNLIVVEKFGDSWKGSLTLVQGRMIKDGKWDNRKIEFASIDKDPETIVGDLLHTLYSYLDSCKGSLFNVETRSEDVETDSNEVTQ